ncbi:MAG TPA: hypothetical protein VHZ98_16285 [Galbitalea sp.]|jgi:hypothetical protein|nr:hypothetical protein [Galbitalea sp.]
MIVDIAGIFWAAVFKDLGIFWAAITSNPWTFLAIISLLLLGLMVKIVEPPRRRSRARSTYYR